MQISIIRAQEIKLKIIPNQDSIHPVLNNLILDGKYIDKTNIASAVDSVNILLNKKGYLNVLTDSLIQSEKEYRLYLSLGKQIKTIKIYYTQISKNSIQDNLLIDDNQITTNYFIIPFDQISTTLQGLSNYFEEKGNSFTTVQLKNISIQNETAQGELQINTSQKRTIDKIIITGYEKFPKKYLRHTLNIKSGTIFNKKILQSLSETINRLDFVTQTKPPEVLFTSDSTYIYLHLKKKKANQFDGVLGFASQENNNSLVFNGYLDFKFLNIFNNGERISLFWKNNGNDNQRFYLAATIPYIFKSPLTPDVQFEIFRKDTTFNNTTLNINLAYSLYNYGNIAGVLHTESSNNLQEDQTDENIKSYKNIFYGINYQLSKLNTDPLFPIKYYLNFSSLVGNRKTTSVKTNQVKLNFTGNYQYAFNLRHYLFIQNQSAFLISDDYVNNELYRFGGTNTLRGVNEESIFASLYTVFNIEYRFRPNNQSYFYSITDFSYFENDVTLNNSNIFSLGLGYAFRTKIGLLNLSYAVAKQSNTPFVLENSTVHIKIVSLF